MAAPPLSACDASATANTAIYLVIRKILQSRYYFTDEENKTGSLRVAPRSQLVIGRVRSVRLQTSTLAITFQLEVMAWLEAGVGRDTGIVLPNFPPNLGNVRKTSENLFKYFEGLGAWDLESSRLRSWKSRVPTLISSLILHASSTKSLLLFDSLFLSP